ncbi:MAG TPA: AAA family ATPase [Syntrophales bacterium]|nr:AAA family ATPase [Syntrophales bacterium]HOL59056.1 AAA family ATPase [Syntrophales bacterium]HPO35435.1 AAA family ATPase [Syntrophales bacterium]
MKIFVIVGMPASGKNIAREYAESQGIPYVATGDIVRAEAERRGISTQAESMAQLSDELRGRDGLGVTRRAIDYALTMKSDVVFLEGMRSWPEIEMIRERANCVVVAFVAPRALRRERIAIRGRADDAPELFDVRDLREISYGAAVPIALADYYVLNDSSLEHAREELRKIVEAGPK